MSKYTFSRIPKEVRDIFNFFEQAANLSQATESALVNKFREKSKKHYETFNRFKLTSKAQNKDEKIYNPQDFPPVTRDFVSRVFNNPIKLEENLNALYSYDKTGGQLFTTRNQVAHHVKRNQALILSFFASFYSPLTQIPANVASEMSFAWYEKLLADTPVIFFLRQSQRLMTDSNFKNINLPKKMFTSKLSKIRSRYVNDTDINKRIRNYHLSELITADLFRLAVENEVNHSSESGYGKENMQHSSASSSKDQLCSNLFKLCKPTILKDNKPVKFVDEDIVTEHIMKLKVQKPISDEKQKHILESFPFDIKYNDLYILTIEEPILGDNHEEFLDLVSSQKDLEVVAVRITGQGFNSDLQQKRADLFNNSDSTYDDLLSWAKAQREKRSSNFLPELFGRLSQLNLTKVEENKLGTALYFLNS